AARLAGADEFIDALPKGYETMIGEHGYSLSGGQRQRVAIARAVLAEPRVLILDDATSAVDPTKEHEIRGALREVMTGRTTLIIGHRPATLALARRLVLGRFVILILSRVGERFLRALRERVFRHLLGLGMDFFEQEQTGRLVARMTSDVDALQDLIQFGLIMFVQNALLFGGALVVIF